MAWALKGALQGPPGAAGASNAVYTQEWTWSNQTAVPPNNTQIRTDTGDWAAATKVYIDDNSNDGADRSTGLSLIRAGDELRISQRTDDTRWARWSVTAAPTDHSGYWEIPVAYLAGGGAIPNSGTAVIVNLLTLGATAVVVADETAVLPRRAVLNFTGAGVTAVDDAANDRINVTIPEAVAATNAQTGTSYTLIASDHNKIVTLSNAAAITLTVPAGLGAGFSALIIQLGAGKVTVTASGVTIVQRQSFTKTAGQYAVASLLAYAANTFALSGDLGT